MDNRSREQRSRNMAHIPSKGTKPEETVRKYLFAHGFRYRKNVMDLPGKPDVVLPKYRTVIFINGCFWHAHSGCRWYVPPKTNVEFWQKKLAYNTNRDAKNYEKLESLGWKVIIVWECEIRHGDQQARLEKLIAQIVASADE